MPSGSSAYGCFPFVKAVCVGVDGGGVGEGKEGAIPVAIGKPSKRAKMVVCASAKRPLLGIYSVCYSAKRKRSWSL